MRSERINTQAVLRGFPGTANWTNPTQRMEERDRVIEYWPEDLVGPVRIGTVAAPPWRLFLDPLSWKDVEPSVVHTYVRTYLRVHGRWPSLDGLRKRFGRVSNHRGPGEIPAQESLL